MSYLELPRLHFFGTFKAAPSTINNSGRNFDVNRPAVPLWNPRGLAEFQILQGSEITIPPGANVVPTTVRSLVTSTGVITRGDPLIGQFVISTNAPSTGKLVDLDPNQQGVSQVWGMQIAIGELGGEQVIGDFTAAYFQQLFAGASGARNLQGRGMPAFSAAYQSLLTNLRWPETITSRFLQTLRAASPDALSIRFTVDLIDVSSTLPGGVPNPNFTLGRVAGAIGPASPNDPPFLNPRGRMLRPVPLTATNETLSMKGTADQAEEMKADAGSSPSLMRMAVDASETFTLFNYAPTIVDSSRNMVVLDLGNALQFSGKNPVQSGTLTAAIVTTAKTIPLGTIDNTLTNYEERAFVFEFPLDTSEKVAAAASNPIVVQWNGSTVLSENTSGAYVDAIDHVVRMEANSRTALSLFATTFGGPVAAGQTATLGPVQTFSGQPVNNVLQVTPETVALDGATTFTLISGNPDGQRAPIDGQVYAIPIIWDEDENPDANAFVSVLVFDALSDDSPTWANVQPIFQQFMHLYPGMQSILDLSDEPTVKANAKVIAAYLRAPITDSRHMPVTRDLSNAKRQMILDYLATL